MKCTATAAGENAPTKLRTPVPSGLGVAALRTSRTRNRPGIIPSAKVFEVPPEPPSWLVAVLRKRH